MQTAGAVRARRKCEGHQIIRAAVEIDWVGRWRRSSGTNREGPRHADGGSRHLSVSVVSQSECGGSDLRYRTTKDHNKLNGRRTFDTHFSLYLPHPCYAPIHTLSQ